MSPYFYSLGMLVNRADEGPYAEVDTLLAQSIADEEAEPPKALTDWIESCQKVRRE